VNIYELLGIDEHADLNTIRRAYAALIKQYRPDTHPTQFGDIRAAYEIAVSNFHANAAEKAEPESISDEASTANINPAQTLEPTKITETPQAAETIHTEAQHQVNTFLFELIELSNNSNELTAEQLTTDFLNSLDQYTLDETSAIEIEILNWIFNTPHPLLLSFQKLDNYFKWTKHHTFSRGEFSHSAVEWLSNVRTAADFYASAIEKNDTNLASHPNSPWLMPLTKNTSNVRKQWEQLCDSTGYIQLKLYFKRSQNSKFPMFWTDILIATVGGAVAWLFTKNNGGITPYFTIPLAFLATLASSVYIVPLLTILSKSASLGNLRPWIIGISIYALLATLHTIQKDAPLNSVPPSINDSTLSSAKLSAPTQIFDKEEDLPDALKYLGLQEPVNNESKISLPLIQQCYGVQKTSTPVYPEESRLRNEQGTVVIKLLIDSKGNVAESSVKQSSGIDRLDKAALETVKTWCFNPPQRQGKPTTGVVEVPFNFKLD